MITDQKQENGENSTNLQAKGDITYIQNTFVLSSVEELAKQLLNSAFGELPDIVKEQIEKKPEIIFPLSLRRDM